MNIWRREIILALALCFLALIIGAILKQTLLVLFLTVSAMLIVQTFQVYRFEKWMSHGAKGSYPKANGVWEDIYYHIYGLKKQEKRRKKKLGKMIDQFRKSTAALPDATVVLGPDDEIEWCNKAAQQVLGLQKSDKGQRIPNLIRFPEFNHFIKTKDYSSAIVLPSPVNEQLLLKIRVVTYGAGLRLLLAQDITQLKKMETMRTDFVANVSHELRTPLTVLKGYVETLTDFDDGQSKLLTNSLLHMQGQTERMENLINDLLLLTRLETQQKEQYCVNIGSLLQQLCMEADKLQYKGRIELTLDSDANIYGVENELRSAFSNLLVNALKYSPDDSLVKLHWFDTDSGIQLDVVDQGEGIAALNIPRVTERFYRVEVKRSKKLEGTGLGLAIVKHVLLRHDGKLKIHSQLDKGSCFSCVFPEKRRC